MDYEGLLASVDPEWSGTLAYTAVVPAERLKVRAPYHRAFSQPTQVSCR